MAPAVRRPPLQLISIKLYDARQPYVLSYIGCAAHLSQQICSEGSMVKWKLKVMVVNTDQHVAMYWQTRHQQTLYPAHGPGQTLARQFEYVFWCQIRFTHGESLHSFASPISVYLGMMSSTEREVHNLLHCCLRRIEPWPLAPYTEHWMKLNMW